MSNLPCGVIHDSGHMAQIIAGYLQNLGGGGSGVGPVMQPWQWAH